MDAQSGSDSRGGAGSSASAHRQPFRSGGLVENGIFDVFHIQDAVAHPHGDDILDDGELFLDDAPQTAALDVAEVGASGVSELAPAAGQGKQAGDGVADFAIEPGAQGWTGHPLQAHFQQRPGGDGRPHLAQHVDQCTAACFCRVERISLTR